MHRALPKGSSISLVTNSLTPTNPDTNPDPNPDPKHVPRSYDIGDSDTVGFSIRGTWAAHFPVADPTPNPQPLIGGVYPGNLPHDFDCFVDSKGWTDTALAWGHRTAHTLGAEAYIEAISGIGGITLVETLHSEPFFWYRHRKKCGIFQWPRFDATLI